MKELTSTLSQHGTLVGGEWIQGASYGSNLNPSNLGDTTHVEAAVTFPTWATGDFQARSDAFEKIGSKILANCEKLGVCWREEEPRARAGVHMITRPHEVALEDRFLVDSIIGKKRYAAFVLTQSWNASGTVPPMLPPS